MKKHFCFLLTLLICSFSACEKEEPEDLYLQSLTAIKKSITGKWQWQTMMDGVDDYIHHPQEWYIDFFEDYYITCRNGYFQKVSFEWRYLPIPSEIKNEKTYVMWDKEKNVCEK
jgi:hypothetical protein